MPHAIVHHGKFELNRPRLRPGTDTYLRKDRRSRPIPTTTADGIHFAYMTKGLHDFVAVKADTVLLRVAVPLRKQHTNGKGFPPGSILVNNAAARSLLLDMIQANPSLEARLTPLFEKFLTTRKTLVPKRVQRRKVTRIPASLAGPDGTALSAAREGRKKLVTHLTRERSAALAKAKKAVVLRRTGTLTCEACGFDFAQQYPGIGVPYAEVHHLRPLSTLASPSDTTLRQLALLCSNCHRMIHFTDPMKSPAALRRTMHRGA